MKSENSPHDDGYSSGMVIRGSRNIFTVLLEDETVLECRIKGKVLKGVEGYYNPLAPGDRVSVEADPLHPGTGKITALEKRRTVFTRFNQKGSSSQLLAANADLVLCVTTPASPPFRPRFLDRALLQADAAGIPPLIVVNKSDLFTGDTVSDDLDVDERLEDFRRIGYTVLNVSAKTGEGLDELRSLLEGKFSVLVGQSGVGKSSLINALLPFSNIRVGAINEKYDRGNHTTTQAAMVELPGSENEKRTWIIDTPGIRRFVPDGVKAGETILYLREFAPLAGKCTYGLSCSHRVEPGCKIMEAVAAGVIHEDRYESFLRIQDELEGKNYVD
ncbi:MAG: ribosome small subunit-dependent GTPase A [Treponema sp.]|jgi:ribosome biogenesis GTPase|nr:ribosome small subunit-dependent GTPase A [Treponema sp.]